MDGWSTTSKSLVRPAERKDPDSDSASALDAALVIAGDEDYLQHYSRHGLDLMLARLLYHDPQCILGDQDAHPRAKLCHYAFAEDRPAPSDWKPATMVCSEHGQDHEKEAVILDLIWQTIDTDSPESGGVYSPSCPQLAHCLVNRSVKSSLLWTPSARLTSRGAQF